MQIADEDPPFYGQAQDAPRWRAYSNASMWCGFLAIVLGISVLAGWASGIEFLKTVVPGFSSMKPNTAVFFIALGVALTARAYASEMVSSQQQLPNTIASWCSALVIVLSACTLLEYGAGLSLGIDQLLFRESSPTLYPGRMAPATALAFLALSLSLVSSASANHALIDPRSVLAFIALSISGVALIGFLGDPPALSQLTTYAGVAVHTALGLIALSCGTLLYFNKRQPSGAADLADATQDSITARPALRLTIISTFGFLALAAAGSILLFLSVIKAQSWVQHTLVVQQTGESMLGALRDAEIGQRGFIMTGDRAHLEPYDRAVTSIPGLQAKLLELTADNPAQQLRLKATGLLISTKLNELNQTIEFERTGRHADAMGLVTSNLGKEAMDSIRDNVAKLIADEKVLLDQRQIWLQRMQYAGITAALL